MKFLLLITILFSLSSSSFAKEYSFDDLYKLALRKDPRVSDFRYSHQILKEKLLKVEAAFYPKLSYSLAMAPMGKVTNEDPSGTFSDMDFSEWGVGLDNNIRLVQPIFTFGKWSTGMKMAKKRAEIEGQKLKKLNQQVKHDLIKAYQALVMISELEKISNFGEKQLNKALKKLKQLDEEDSDDYNETDYFKLKISQQKLIDGQNDLSSLKAQIRFALIKMLDIEEDFTVKDKRLKENKLKEEFNVEEMFEYQMLMKLIDISKLNLNLQKNYFTPDVFFWVTWGFKYSNVAIKQKAGWDPYHKNIVAAGLGLRWNLDFMTLKANYKIAKIQLIQNQNRVNLLKKISSIKDFKIKSEILNLKNKIDVKRNIAKQSKRWFTGNALDYYTGLGSTKELLESLASYQKAKLDIIRAIYNYNVKLSSLKLFRGEN